MITIEQSGCVDQVFSVEKVTRFGKYENEDKNRILLGNNGDSKWNDPITRAEVLALFERIAKVWGEESNKTK
jgi:hypothetical protein